MNSLPCTRGRWLFALFATCTFLFTTVGNVPAQTTQKAGNEDEPSVQPVHTFGKPVFLFQTYAFASDRPGEEKLYLYLGFVNDVLQFVKEGERRFRARYEVSADVLDQNLNQIDGDTWRGELIAQTFEETNSRTEFHLTSVELKVPPGEHQLRFELVDLDTKNHLQREKELSVPDFSEHDALRMSDVVFADSIAIRPGGHVWFVPNLNRSRDDPESQFSSYCEIYPAVSSDSVRVTYKAVDWRRETVFTLAHQYSGGEAPVREILGLGDKIDKPGRYYLEICVEQGRQTITRTESFYIARVGEEEEPFEFSEDVVTLEPLKYILSEAEFDRLSAAPEDERRRTVSEFWEGRDPDPSTSRNELEEEFYRRVHFANQHFSVTADNKQGWETDRGRIYIIYGQPTEVRQHRLDLNKPPLEVWYYLRDNHRFIFQDKEGTGEYVLIHER